MVIVDSSRADIVRHGKSNYSNLNDCGESVDRQWYSQNFSCENYKVFNYNFGSVLKGISNLTSSSLEKLRQQAEPILERLRAKRVCQKCSSTLPVFKCQSVQTPEADFKTMNRFDDQYVSKLYADPNRMQPIREYSNTEWASRVRRRNDASRMNQEFSGARPYADSDGHGNSYEGNHRPAKVYNHIYVQHPSPNRYYPAERPPPPPPPPPQPPYYPPDLRYDEYHQYPYAHHRHTDDCACCECDGCPGCRARSTCCKYGRRRRRRSWANRAYCYIRHRFSTFRKSDFAQQTYPNASAHVSTRFNPIYEDELPVAIDSANVPHFVPEEVYDPDYNVADDDCCCCCCCCCSGDGADGKKDCNSSFAQTAQHTGDLKTNGTQTEKCKCRCRCCCKKRKQQGSYSSQPRVFGNPTRSQMHERTKIYRSSATQHEHFAPKEQLYNVLYGQASPSPLFLEPIFSSPLTGKKYNIAPAHIRTDAPLTAKCATCSNVLSDYLEDLKPTKIPTDSKVVSAMFDALADKSEISNSTGTFHKNPWSANELPTASESESVPTSSKSTPKRVRCKGKCGKKSAKIAPTLTDNESNTNDKVISNIGDILGKYTLEDLEVMLDNATKKPCNCKSNAGDLVEAAQIVNHLMDESIQCPTTSFIATSINETISKSTSFHDFPSKIGAPQLTAHCFDKVSSISSGYASGASSMFKESAHAPEPNYKPLLDNIKEEDDERKAKCLCTSKKPLPSDHLMDLVPIIPLIPPSNRQEKFEDLSNITEKLDEEDEAAADETKTEDLLEESDVPSQIESLPKLPSQTTDHSSPRPSPPDAAKLPSIHTRTGLNFLGKKGYVKLKQVFKYKSRLDLSKDCKCSNESMLGEGSKAPSLEKYNNVKRTADDGGKEKENQKPRVLTAQEYEDSDSQSLE